MRSRFLGPALGLVALTLAVHAPTASPMATRTLPGVRGALLISIDGLRPDLVLRASAPELKSLMERGSFTLWAATTAASVTLPSHTSMLTGVTPSRHGIEWNRDLPFRTPVYPLTPTLFELARRAGFSTAMVTGKSKFSALAKPGTLSWSFVPESTATDSAVTDTAVRWIESRRPGVMFVHLPGVDVMGHARGWGSPAQLGAVATADRCVGRMLAALRRGHRLDGTVVLVTADHGGAGLTHGPDDPRSRAIPWIIAGPGIRRDYDLSSGANGNVRTEDTFATLCWLLGIPLANGLDGHPVTAILEAHRAPGRAGGAANAKRD